jgi:oligopeptide/dipeptide ABC transporter ATP-binding protein
MVFQNPDRTLNARRTILDAVARPLELFGLADRVSRRARAGELLRAVGLGERYLDLYPGQVSGGERQRVAIARAFACGPDLVVCDEPTSALDVSVQATVLNLLVELQRQARTSYVFISHDLSVVRHVSDRVAVMYLGQIVEQAPVELLFGAPGHPYTKALLSAIPVPDPRRRPDRIVLSGDVPSPAKPPAGCRFHTRCPAVMPRCSREAPPAYRVGAGHEVSCFLADPAGAG